MQLIEAIQTARIAWIDGKPVSLVQPIEAKLTPKQAEMVQAIFDDWLSYYSDGSNAEPGNMHSDDVTLEHAQEEQVHAARFEMRGKTFMFIPGTSLLADVCHELEMIVEDMSQSDGDKRTAAGALAKLSEHNTY